MRPVADPEQFLITGPPELLGELVQAIEGDPDTELVSVSGPPAAPELVVARLPLDLAERVRRGDHRLLVEVDAPLRPSAFDGAGLAWPPPGPQPDQPPDPPLVQRPDPPEPELRPPGGGPAASDPTTVSVPDPHGGAQP